MNKTRRHTNCPYGNKKETHRTAIGYVRRGGTPAHLPRADRGPAAGSRRAMFAAGADAAAGVAFAVAVEPRACACLQPLAFSPLCRSRWRRRVEVRRALLRVETIATRPALSSRVAVANVQANAEDIVETRDARCARVVVRHSRRTRHRIINLFTSPSKTSIEERFVTPPPVRCGSPLATSHAHSNIFASCAQSVISSLYVSFSSNPKRVYALPTALIAPTTTADRRWSTALGTAA